jgi:hypothetical protein
MVDPVGPQGPPTRPAASAYEARTPQAARVPPMDYRDNLKRRTQNHIE